eukprot:TRINITY_DN26900_c0_g1_i1.p1 TRINITY_DN26900_c0_g1~~TRINITY_DN26900_c0_g1_i1.p1  ORF type:complete len:537 (+),score=91.65 TRINITY_DN26900_c0_g1_i1:73-1611(+)
MGMRRLLALVSTDRSARPSGTDAGGCRCADGLRALFAKTSNKKRNALTHEDAIPAMQIHSLPTTASSASTPAGRSQAPSPAWKSSRSLRLPVEALNNSATPVPGSRCSSAGDRQRCLFVPPPSHTASFRSVLSPVQNAEMSSPGAHASADATLLAQTPAFSLAGSEQRPDILEAASPRALLRGEGPPSHREVAAQVYEASRLAGQLALEASHFAGRGAARLAEEHVLPTLSSMVSSVLDSTHAAASGAAATFGHYLERIRERNSSTESSGSGDGWADSDDGEGSPSPKRAHQPETSSAPARAGPMVPALGLQQHQQHWGPWPPTQQAPPAFGYAGAVPLSARGVPPAPAFAATKPAWMMGTAAAAHPQGGSFGWNGSSASSHSASFHVSRQVSARASAPLEQQSHAVAACPHGHFKPTQAGGGTHRAVATQQHHVMDVRAKEVVAHPAAAAACHGRRSFDGADALLFPSAGKEPSGGGARAPAPPPRLRSRGGLPVLEEEQEAALPTLLMRR